MQLNFGCSSRPGVRRDVCEPGRNYDASGLTWPRVGNAILVLIASLAFALGLLVYLFDRPPAHAALLPSVLAFGAGSLFGALGYWLPSFVHTFAFSLFSAALCSPAPRPAYRVCLAWWLVNVTFELGQHAQIREFVVSHLQQPLSSAWVTRLVSNYLERGTFDVGDLVAATLGSLAAASVLYVKHHREVSNAK